MGEPFSSNDLRREAANQRLQSPLEPKQEPFDEFSLISTENQTSNRSTSTLKEPKEELLSPFHSPTYQNEVNDDNIFKKEEIYEEEFGIDSFDFPHDPDNSSFSTHSKDNTVNISSSFKYFPYQMKDAFDSAEVADYVVDSEEVGQSLKKSIPGKKEKGKTSGKMLAGREYRKAKENDKELGCPQCEFRSRSVMSWDSHLRKFHGTTPAQAGVALLCECGVECISYQHNNKCNIANFTVIQKKRATPQCILCKKFPKTISAYIAHLQYQHNSTLNANGIFLICSCGFFIGSTIYNAYCHIKECPGRIFSLHKVNDEEFEYSRDMSKIWRYFVKTKWDWNREKYGRCTLCSWGMQLYSGCLVNMWSHLRDLHPMEYSTIQPNESHSANRQYYLTGVGGPVCDIPPSNLILPRPPEEMGEEEFKDGVKEELKEELKEEVKEELMYDY